MSIYNAIAQGFNPGAGMVQAKMIRNERADKNAMLKYQQEKEQQIQNRHNEKLAQRHAQKTMEMVMNAQNPDQARAIFENGQREAIQNGFMQPDEAITWDQVQGMYAQPNQKPPQSRTVPIEGGRQVTQEWNGQEWVDVASAERWNPKSGVTVNVNPEKQPPTPAVKTAVQKSIIEGEKSLRDLNSIKDAHSEEFLTAFGRFKAWLGSGLDKVNSDAFGLAQFNARRSAFASNVKQFFNQYRKEITGAAASEKELQQLVESLFSDELGPQEFSARFNEFFSKAEANLAENKKLASEGIDVGGSVDADPLGLR